MSLRRLHVNLAAALVSTLLAACAGPRPAPEPEPVEPEPETRPVPRTEPRALAGLTVIATGDVMLGTDFPDERTPPAGHPGIMAPVADILSDADITFINYEGVIMDGGEPEKVCETPSLCYLFRTPTRLADQLTHAGVDVVSLANNHARDFGEVGRTATMQTLDTLGIHHSGREGDVARWSADGVDVAMIAFAPNIGSHDLNDIPTAAQLVREEAAGADLVIVSMHGGAEGSDAVHVPHGPEEYYGEIRGDLRAFSHAVIDAGADLVIGHGPHVPRGMELYKDRLIAYSLGNFATHWGIKVTGRNGLAPILKVDVTGDGEFVEGRIISAHQVRPDGVFVDRQSRAARLMMQLTKADFPDTPLIITPTGELQRPDLLQQRAKSYDPWDAARQRGAIFRAIGQEPGWYIEIIPDEAIHLVYDYGEQEAAFPVPEATTTKGGDSIYETETEADHLKLRIEPVPCTDAMSGEPSPLTVTVTLDDRELHGCGRWLEPR